MRYVLTSIALMILLSPALAVGGEVTMSDLVGRDGLYYMKFSEVPFTGEVTGWSQGSLKDGKRYGPWLAYHDNGQLLKRGTYKDGKLDGPWVAYHDNGQLLEKGAYKDGKLDGPWAWYLYSGQLLSKGTFKDGKLDGP